ncbi:AAEL011297-PB [Aedes aegypti]|uniref:AAEL011297-PB n=1 Tax=Aedes aegypti TaxID=7159 RepID=Q16QG2_AEDAE|nr:AAEL011297-PB [Aedes aegypti]
MIIMRALVATVLLITVVLVSIVLINANSRHVRSGATITRNDDGDLVEVDRTEAEVITSGSYEDELLGSNPEQNQNTFEFEDSLTDSAKTSESSTLINAIRKAGGESDNEQSNTSSQVELNQAAESEALADGGEDEEIVVLHETHNIDPGQTFDDVVYTEEVAVDSKSTEAFDQVTGRSPTTPELTTEDVYYVEDAPAEANAEKQEEHESENTYLEQHTVNDIKTLPKENQWGSRKTSPATERQTPLGYEPESYIVVDEDMFKSTKVELENAFAEQDDLLAASSSISSRPLERKQRAAVGNPETIVLNRAPIVPHFDDDYREPGCPHMFPPPPPGPRYVHSMERGARPSYPGLESIYNPHNWDAHNMNLLRFPQCSACQRKQVPLCRSCGRCSECCLHSGCTCGCLHS